MKLVISFLLLPFLCFKVSGCELKQNVVSLSGPMTMLFEEMDLLKDKNLKAISTFHPIDSETTAQILSGGLFLSKKTIKKFHDSLFIFDKSRELEKLFRKEKVKNTLIVNSIEKDSFDNIDENIEIAKKITKNCSDKLETIKNFVSSVKKELLKSKLPNMIFFLGKVTKSKLPELVIVNDGFVKFLKNNKVIETYKSDLAYLNWSQKELKAYDSYLKIGLNEKRKSKENIIKIDNTKYNLFYRGVLTPGIRQIYFLKELTSLTFH